MSAEHARHFAIRNGLIVDGKGGHPYSGDVVIRRGQIAEVEAEAGSRADKW